MSSVDTFLNKLAHDLLKNVKKWARKDFRQFIARIFQNLGRDKIFRILPAFVIFLPEDDENQIFLDSDSFFDSIFMKYGYLPSRKTWVQYLAIT